MAKKKKKAYENPALKLFNGDSALVGQGFKKTAEGKSYESVLYFRVMYSFEKKCATFSLYDVRARSHAMELVHCHSFEEALAMLNLLAVDYPEKLKVQDFLPTLEIFFRAAPGITMLEKAIDDNGWQCNGCGMDSMERMYLFYTPAVPDTKLKHASLSLHWGCNCFDGFSHEGKLSDVKEDVLQSLKYVQSQVSDKHKATVQEYIITVESFSE